MTNQPANGHNLGDLLAEQTALLVRIENDIRAGRQAQTDAGTLQTELVENLYKYMRLTVDMQEVAISRLNIIALTTTVTAILAVIGTVALLTQ